MLQHEGHGWALMLNGLLALLSFIFGCLAASCPASHAGGVSVRLCPNGAARGLFVVAGLVHAAGAALALACALRRGAAALFVPAATVGTVSAVLNCATFATLMGFVRSVHGKGAEVPGGIDGAVLVFVFSFLTAVRVPTRLGWAGLS
jgi:hypothetical protein